MSVRPPAQPQQLAAAMRRPQTGGAFRRSHRAAHRMQRDRRRREHVGQIAEPEQRRLQIAISPAVS